MSKKDVKLALYITAGIAVASGGVLYQVMPFIKRMLTQGPVDYMGPLGRKRGHIIACDIPIPFKQDEEFDTDILIEWYEDQKSKGLIEQPTYMHPNSYKKEPLEVILAREGKN